MKGSIKKSKIGIIENIIFSLMIFSSTAALISYLLIFFNEGVLAWSFNSSGFNNFTTIFSVPLKCLSGAIALLSLWAVLHNLNRTRVSFVFSHLSSELNKCEEEIKDLLAIEFPIETTRNLLRSNLKHPNKQYICTYFDNVGNPTLKIDEIIPHFINLGIREDHAIYRTYTQKLTLRLQRYVIALLEINKVSDEDYFVKYYASKYTTIMKELYQFDAQMDIKLVHAAVQLASMELKYDFDFETVNGKKSIEIETEFFKEMGVKKI